MQNDHDARMKALSSLHAEIDARVTSILRDHGHWSCRKGCDNCCKRLADIPQLTPPEWTLLQQGLGALSSKTLDDVADKMAALTQTEARPVTCPLLDEHTGACRVYEHRPIACRTYGFYVQRHLGLYCKEIEQQVAAGEWTNVIWGNHDAIDRRLNELGESKSLTAWFLNWNRQP